jgi:hypothetical protein
MAFSPQGESLLSMSALEAIAISSGDDELLPETRTATPTSTSFPGIEVVGSKHDVLRLSHEEEISLVSDVDNIADVEITTPHGVGF